jgi:hypothetical protein
MVEGKTQNGVRGLAQKEYNMVVLPLDMVFQGNSLHALE